MSESCKMVSKSYGIFKSKAAEQVGGNQPSFFFFLFLFFFFSWRSVCLCVSMCSIVSFELCVCILWAYAWGAFEVVGFPVKRNLEKWEIYWSLIGLLQGNAYLIVLVWKTKNEGLDSQHWIIYTLNHPSILEELILNHLHRRYYEALRMFDNHLSAHLSSMLLFTCQSVVCFALTMKFCAINYILKQRSVGPMFC